MLRDETIGHLLSVPQASGPPMAMGWARAPELEHVSFGAQGSNTLWAAAVLLDAHRERAALVVANDGRSSVVAASAQLAARLL